MNTFTHIQQHIDVDNYPKQLSSVVVTNTDQTLCNQTHPR